MSTLNEIVFSVLSPVKPYLSGDSRLTYEKVAYDVKNQRALLIRNELNKSRAKDPAFIQSLGCVPIQAVDATECCEIKSGCYIMRTVDKIPAFLMTHSKKQITRVGPIVLSKRPYSFITYTQAIYTGENKFTKNEIYAFELNNYIYLMSKDSSIFTMKYINIQGILENPEDAAAYACTDEDSTPCYNDDSPYPISDWMVPYIENILQEKYMKTYMIVPKDQANDAEDQATDR
jgi:hypothetical protein